MNGVRFHIISPSRPHGTGGGTCRILLARKRGEKPHTRTASRMTSRKSSSPDLPEGYMTRASRASPVQANTNIGLRLE